MVTDGGPRSLSRCWADYGEVTVISFLLTRNDRPLARGAVRDGVLTAMVTSLTASADREAELRCSLGGLETAGPTHEHLEWVDVAELHPGDVISIRIDDAGEADAPIRRTASIQGGGTPPGPQRPGALSALSVAAASGSGRS
jgi:hypothetical protein